MTHSDIQSQSQPTLPQPVLPRGVLPELQLQLGEVEADAFRMFTYRHWEVRVRGARLFIAGVPQNVRSVGGRCYSYQIPGVTFATLAELGRRLIELALAETPTEYGYRGLEVRLTPYGFWVDGEPFVVAFADDVGWVPPGAPPLAVFPSLRRAAECTVDALILRRLVDNDVS